MNGGVSSSPRTFDVANENDVISLLKEVRHSTLDPQTKDDIRDVVFDLRANHDQALVDELQLYVKPLGITLQGGSGTILRQTPAPAVAPAVTTPPPATSRIGQARPVPNIGFAPVSVAATPSAAPASQPVTTVSEPEPAATKIPVTPLPVEPAVAEPVAPEPVAAPATTQSGEQALTRIKAIKAEVNALVGNPVNLIDADNTVGREYMNALLEAMKAASANADVTAEMARLETAYVAVQNTIGTKAQPAPVAPEQISEVVEETPAPAVTSAPEPVPAVEPVAEVTPAPVTPPTPEPDISEPAAAMSSEPTPVEPVVPEPAATPTREPVASEPVAPVLPTGLQSLATDLENAEAKAEAEAAAESVAPVTSADPLNNPEVDAGLRQLLSEWELFKGSGLFGRGAAGEEHKLYLELKNLHMNVVMAGRFEGATPEVRQSLADYMNGWRYEQGMTHDAQETFEHYLRRVIRAIIDKRAAVAKATATVV